MNIPAILWDCLLKILLQIAGYQFIVYRSQKKKSFEGCTVHFVFTESNPKSHCQIYIFEFLHAILYVSHSSYSHLCFALLSKFKMSKIIDLEC